MGRKSLVKTIQSVLGQSIPVRVCVVVDSKCTSNLKSLFEFASQVEIYTPNISGISKLRNFGLEKVQTEFFSFLDDDDCWFPNFAEVQISYLKMGVNAIASSALYNNENNVLIRPSKYMNVKTSEQFFRKIYSCSFGRSKYYVPVGSVVFRSKEFIKFRFDENMTIREDIKYLGEVSQIGLAQHSEPLLIINANRSRSWERDNYNEAKIWYRHLSGFKGFLGLRFLVFEFLRTKTLASLIRLVKRGNYGPIRSASGNPLI